MPGTEQRTSSIGGYPKYSTFGTTVGSRSAEGRDEFLRYHAAAIEIPSPAIARIESLSKAIQLFLVIGVIEKEGGTLYCTVIFVDPECGLVGKHRKLVPTALERVIWGMGDSSKSNVPVIEKSFPVANSETVQAKISAAICWENYMPLLRTFYYQQGTQIYCAPTVDSRPTWQHSMIHIALEGRCFVLSACQFSQQRDYPPSHAIPMTATRNPDGVMCGGGSVIINPLGEILAGPLLDGEGVLTAELNLEEVVKGKFDLDVVGHYARPDAFQLRVNLKDNAF